MKKRYIKPVMMSFSVNCAQMLADSGLHEAGTSIEQNLSSSTPATNSTTGNLSRDNDQNAWVDE